MNAPEARTGAATTPGSPATFRPDAPPAPATSPEATHSNPAREQVVPGPLDWPVRSAAIRAFARDALARVERWGLWLLTLGIAASIYLGSVRIPEAEFSLIGSSDLVALRFTGAATLNALTVRDVSVSGLRQVDTLDGTAPPAKFDDADLKIETSGAATSTAGHVSIPALPVSPDTIVTLEKIDAPGRYLLVLAPAQAASRDGRAGSLPPIRVRVVVAPGLSLRYSDRPTADGVTGMVPRPLELQGDTSGLEIAFTLIAPEADLVSTAAIDDLRLWSIEARGTTPGARTSGIRDGRVTFLTTPDLPVVLDKRDDIDLDLSSGILHVLSLTSQTMELNVSGNIDDLRKRIGFSMPSQMPTWLDHLSHLTSVRLVVAIVTFLAGLQVHKLLRRTR